jgi:hypothetical protein
MLRRVLNEKVLFTRRTQNFLKFAPRVHHYFTDTFSKDDKFTKDRVILEGVSSTTAGDYAKDLFRYAYNTNQLGYFYLSLEKLEEYRQAHGLPEGDISQSLKDYMEKEGIADEIAKDFIERIYLLRHNYYIPAIVSNYKELYRNYFKYSYGSLQLAEPPSSKYFAFYDKCIRMSAANLTRENYVCEFSIELKPELIEGWASDAGAGISYNFSAKTYTSESEDIAIE